ncbi:helix-turn-helix transcriptional regulator [Methylobacterium sp. P31]
MGTDLDALIHVCYAAAAEPEQWPLVLDQVGAAVGALGLVVTNIARPIEIIASETLKEANEAYAAGWWHLDTRNARGKAVGVRPGTIVRDGDLITPEEKRRDVFFQEFCRPHRLGEFAGYIAPDVSGGILSVSAFRHDRDGDYQAAEIERLRRLAPHVARAYALSKVLADARVSSGNAETALERVQVGAIVLDMQGRVRHMNVVAERLLPGYLRVGADRELHAVVVAEHDKLNGAVISGLGIKDVAATSIILRGTNGRRPIAVEVTSLRRYNATYPFTGSKQGGALVLLRDLFRPASRSVEPQLRQLGLSQAEARVAMLVGRGQSLREVAETFAVTENTVRSQLKSIFSKFGIARQSELAAIVARIDLL